MKYLKKIDKLITMFEEYSITVLLMLMTLITFWGVINRFVLQESLSWSEELARYLSIWAAFIGASLGVKKGAHIGVEAFVSILSPKVKQYVDLITMILSVTFCFGIAYVGYIYGMKLISAGQLSPALRIPIVWAYAAVPVGGFLMGVRYVLLILQELYDITNNNAKGEGV